MKSTQTLLLLKVTLGPLMVALSHYLGKLKGHGMGGRLIGLPITTGPFILIISLQEGAEFGRHAAHGVLLGQIALAIYCWVYTFISPRMNWYQAISIATATVLAVGYTTTHIPFTSTEALLVLIVIWLAAMRFWPKSSSAPVFVQSPSWELPVRIAVTLTIFIGLAALAPHLGANISGALSTDPVIASVVSAFNHRRYGPASTMATLRGLMESFPITIAFIAVLAYSL